MTLTLTTSGHDDEKEVLALADAFLAEFPFDEWRSTASITKKVFPPPAQKSEEKDADYKKRMMRHTPPPPPRYILSTSRRIIPLETGLYGEDSR